MWKRMLSVSLLQILGGEMTQWRSSSIKYGFLITQLSSHNFNDVPCLPMIQLPLIRSSMARSSVLQKQSKAQFQVDDTIPFLCLLDSKERKPYMPSLCNTYEAWYGLPVAAIHRNSSSHAVSSFGSVRRRWVLPTSVRLMRTCFYPEHRSVQKSETSPVCWCMITQYHTSPPLTFVGASLKFSSVEWFAWSMWSSLGIW